MRKTAHHYFYWAFLVLLAAPVLMYWTGWIKTAKLDGAYTVPEYPPLTFQNLSEGRIPAIAEERASLVTTFIPDLIRFANTVDYRWFDEIDESVIRTESGHLLQQGYVQAFRGTLAFDTMRFQQIGARMHRIQAQLAEWGTPMLVVIAPNKADWAYPNEQGTSERIHVRMADEMRRNGIPCIDVHAYFKTLRDDRIFTKNGIHWSTFGAAVALDTLLKKAKKEMWFQMDLQQTDMEQSPTARYRDNDLERILNIWGTYGSETYFYPTNTYTTVEKPPKIVGIGDSFYWTLYDTDWLQHCDSTSVFYYYNQRAVDINMQDIDPSIDRPVENVQSADLVLWVVTEPNSLRLPFDFDDVILP